MYADSTVSKHQIATPDFCQWLFSKQPITVVDTGHRLHFYFSTNVGITSTSYTKSSLIDLMYRYIPKEGNK